MAGEGQSDFTCRVVLSAGIVCMAAGVIWIGYGRVCNSPADVPVPTSPPTKEELLLFTLSPFSLSDEEDDEPVRCVTIVTVVLSDTGVLSFSAKGLS